MSKRTVTQLVDDLDGSPATVTHEVALDGRRVRVDLSPANAALLHDALRPFLDSPTATPLPEPVVPAPAAPEPPTARAPDLATWAQENGVPLPLPGRVPDDVLLGWRAAVLAAGTT